jgi:hypothetical protein
MNWLLLLSTLAGASVYQEIIPLSEGDFDPDEYDIWLEEAAGRAPIGSEAIKLLVELPDGTVLPAQDLLPALEPVPLKEGEPRHRSLPEAAVSRGEGFLADRAIYLSQCHGWIWNDYLGRFATQRGNLFDTVEDFHNPEGMNQYLMAYLENAGAQIFPVKERDLNPLWAFVDNSDDGYTETGDTFSADSQGFGFQNTYKYGENPFKTGDSRVFASDGGGVATWSPEVPQDGYYNLYVAWQSDSNNSRNAHYRVTHPGGQFDRYYDQSVHGSNWRFVANLWMPGGTGGVVVELIADDTEPGRTLSADVVRVGGGMAVIERYGETSERPRWEGGAIQGVQFNGAPSSIYDPYSSGDGSDPTARSRWAEWEHPSGEDAVYLSWHSNATESGTARGTITYYAGNACSSGPAVDGSYELADAVQQEMVDSFRENWEPGWKDRDLGTACFSEVAAYNNDEMPAALVELAFHDNETDTSYLKQPKFRRDASRAMYRGLVRYFAERDGISPDYLPEPPVAVAAVQSGGQVTISWEAGPSGGILGDPASRYLVQASADGRSWDSGVDVQGTSTQVSLASGERSFYRVVAGNDGGLSFPSSVVGAAPSSDGANNVLIVDAFDRLDSGQLGEDYAHSSLGYVARMNLRHMNATDTIVAHGNAVANAGWYFDSASDEAIDTLDLDAYALVIWATGEESTQDETFSSAQQDLLRAFVDGGGALWTSGAEILWDLDGQGSDEDRAFASEVLGASMAADDAGVQTVDGEGPLAGVGLLDFSLDAGAPYPVEWPDTLQSDGTVLARYTSGDIAGALSGQVALFGFPFETIGDPSVRDQVAEALLPLLVPDYTPPEPTGRVPASYPRYLVTDLRGCGCNMGVAPASLPGLFGFLFLVVTFGRRKSYQ